MDHCTLKIPDIHTARSLLNDAASRNPGQWIDHSETAAACAKSIAAQCCHLDAEAAYILALLHDIGRREGVTDMQHIIDGYRYMMQLGCDDCARVCLTHSFPGKELRSYNGQNDCTDEETQFISEFLQATEYDDYDRLIQLCDALALPQGATYIEKRLVDVAIRRGINEYTIPKWKAFLELKDYFDRLTHSDIYLLL